ncbi:iron-sulfur cluster assembly scaffold protein [Novosphingobium sp. AP12]|uniref:iron-sulfur cluster assembly scaffold protein n=1 Tax=Novosphingobium sp. AP12 TaxID=1144305 RepID=UPI000271F5FD|nr:iron-sulfur cluster assembly scaffold protein [Novosphingobium sp. AP12]EJL32960.1 iron-sulfur cluster biosynthesis protein, NifU-like protein [Novosphingobium sp. AP12]
MATTVLYTPDVLGLAIELARYPLSDALPLRGEARSKSCGSTIVLGLSTSADGTVERIGVRSQACAIGQASAAIFASAAAGADAARIVRARDAIAAWLSGDGELPDWPGLETIAAARDYPARHGAVLLPWNAACQALAPD